MYWIYNASDPACQIKEIIILILHKDTSFIKMLEEKLKLFVDKFHSIGLAVISDLSETEQFLKTHRIILIEFSENASQKENESLTKDQNKILISNMYRHCFQGQIISSNIGYHRNIAKFEDFIDNESLEINSFSLGELNENLIICEPLLRNANQIFIDLNCLKLSETLDPEISLPTGLNIEQLCRIVRFACCSESLSNINFKLSDFASNKTNNFTIAAIVIWYLCEALEEYLHIKMLENDYNEYIIDNFTFTYNKNTEQWSLKYLDSQKSIPCIYSDYQSILNGKIPLRIAKLL